MSRDPEKMIERRSRILEILKQNGHARVTELAEMFHTTEVTIRSDLTHLEEEGKLVRMAGGAVIPIEETECAGSLRRAFENAPEKHAIAKRMAAEIQNGDTLFINAGSTTLAFAEALKNHENLNVVTNSLPISNVLGRIHGFHVILVGGEINAEDGFTHGLDATEMLSRYQAKYAVLSLDGITPEGISTIHAEEVSVNRMMMEHALRCVFIADSSKLGKQGFSRFASAEAGEMLITDEHADASAVSGLQNAGMQVLLAQL